MTDKVHSARKGNVFSRISPSDTRRRPHVTKQGALPVAPPCILPEGLVRKDGAYQYPTRAPRDDGGLGSVYLILNGFLVWEQFSLGRERKGNYPTQYSFQFYKMCFHTYHKVVNKLVQVSIMLLLLCLYQLKNGISKLRPKQSKKKQK